MPMMHAHLISLFYGTSKLAHFVWNFLEAALPRTSSELFLTIPSIHTFFNPNYFPYIMPNFPIVITFNKQVLQEVKGLKKEGNLRDKEDVMF